MKLKIYFYLLFVLVLFSGCFGTSQPKIEEKVTKTIPSWYLSPPRNNEEYLYGLGEAADMTVAQKRALENLSQRLSIELSSTSEYKLESYTDFREYTTKSSTQNIKSEITPLIISNYEIIKSDQLSTERVIVLISVKKIKLVKSLKDEIDKKYGEILFQKKNIDNKDILSRKYFLEDSLLVLQTYNNKIEILKNLNTNYDVQRYITTQKNLSKELGDLNNSITVSIHSDENSKSFINVIRSFLITNGFTVTKRNSNIPSHIKLVLNSNITENNAYGIGLVKVLLTLKAISGDKKIGGNIISIKAGSSNNTEDAKQNLINRLNKVLNQNSSDILFRTKMK